MPPRMRLAQLRDEKRPEAEENEETQHVVGGRDDARREAGWSGWSGWSGADYDDVVLLHHESTLLTPPHVP